MALSSGTRLGPYRILGPLGAGGMGEVYRAEDTRLDRQVAIKVLASEFSASADRRGRFEREAKAIAALNHPHICTLHDVGRHEGIDFLVMELLEGKSLAERLRSGPLQIPEVLSCATQIADALDKAHHLGIVHRDLKPANIVLTRSGAKLLDFGLAKLRADETPLVDSMTETAQLTARGQIVGTLQYMAPEQLEGGSIDARTDLYAFGAVVYEMVTGRSAATGGSQAGLISSILKATPPPMAELRPGISPALDRLVAVCLAKDPEERWSSAHDVLLQLKSMVEAAEIGSVGVIEGGTRREWIAWTAAAVGVGTTIALAVLMFSGRSQRHRTVAGLDLLSVLPPAETTLLDGEAPRISPDGQRLAFVGIDSLGRSLIYLRHRDSLTAQPLADTDDASLPFWAPDSRRLGFFAQGVLKTVSIAGGSPTTLAVAPLPRGGTWSRDDVILFSARPNEPPYRIPAAGGQAEQVPTARPLMGFRSFPEFLPDGRHYLYLAFDDETRATSSIQVASLDSSKIQRLVPSKASASFSPAGYLLFRREAALVAQPFDADKLQLSGSPVAVAENIGFNPLTYQALFSVSAESILAYQDLTPGTELAWFDRQGNRLGAITPAGSFNTLCLSADGAWVVYEMSDEIAGTVDLWALALDHTEASSSRLTFDPQIDFYPVCSPSGRDVIFATLREGPPDLFRLTITSPGSELAVLRSPAPTIPTDWSRDGRWLIYSILNPQTSWDVMVVPVSGGEPQAFAATHAAERNGRLSSDGRFMAYVSNETGVFEVYVQPFPTTGAKWQVSRGGGSQPSWRRDGRELFYLTLDKRLIGVEVKSVGSEVELGATEVLMKTRITGWERYSQGCQYAVTDDGERILMSTATATVRPITVALNWQAALRQ